MNYTYGGTSKLLSQWVGNSQINELLYYLIFYRCIVKYKPKILRVLFQHEFIAEIKYVFLFNIDYVILWKDIHL